jgi:hypothetical protein
MEREDACEGVRGRGRRRERRRFFALAAVSFASLLSLSPVRDATTPAASFSASAMPAPAAAVCVCVRRWWRVRASRRGRVCERQGQAKGRARAALPFASPLAAALSSCSLSLSLACACATGSAPHHSRLTHLGNWLPAWGESGEGGRGDERGRANEQSQFRAPRRRECEGVHEAPQERRARTSVPGVAERTSVCVRGAGAAWSVATHGGGGAARGSRE